MFHDFYVHPVTSSFKYIIYRLRYIVYELKKESSSIFKGALGNSHYWHNGQKFPSLSLDRNMVEGSLKAAGCRILEWKELERCCPVEDKPADHSAVFYCLALKI